MPGVQRQVHGHCQTQSHRNHQESNGNTGIDPLVQLAVLQNHAQGNCFHNEQHGGGSHSAVGGVQTLIGIKAVKGTGNHVRKGGNYQDAEQPAEQQEQLLAQLADVGFNDVADGAALVLDGSVHGSKVLYSAEEHAANQNPQKHRQPTEDCRLDGSVDGTGTGNGCKLMAKDHVGVGGDVVHTVLQLVGGSFGFGVNAQVFAR